MKKAAARALEKARAMIGDAIASTGPFTHNMIGIILQKVATDHGNQAANDLIEEYDLTELYGIYPVLDKAKKP